MLHILEYSLNTVLYLQAESQLALMKQDYDRYVEENSEKVDKLTAAVEKLTKDKGMNHSVIIYGNSNT